MEMSPCMGLRGYAGECPGFLGGTNAICECSTYCCLPMALNAQPCYSPPNLDLNSLVLAMHSLWVPIGDRRLPRSDLHPRSEERRGNTLSQIVLVMY